jgi:hypothetical protein
MDKKEFDLEQVRNMLHEQRGVIQRERDNLMEQGERLKKFKQVLETVDLVFKEKERIRIENERLKEKNIMLEEELYAAKAMFRRAEMQKNEMSKLSMSMAGKASQEELLKALRVFVNTSKRKKMEKRIAVKEMVLELANANRLTLPADLAATIDCLDDELPETKVVNVAGNYNDIHDNGNVKL